MEAAAAMHDDRLDIAERILKPHLKEDPFDVRAIRMLADGGAYRTTKDSETLLRRAVEIAPGFTPARTNLAIVLGRLGRPAEALELLEVIFEQDPDGIGNLNLKAATLGRLGDFEQALELYQRVLERAPSQPRVNLTYGHMLNTVGRLQELIDAYRRAIDLNPRLGEAWWSLANLKTFRFSDDDIATMEQTLQLDGLKDNDRFHLEFALGKALHDLGRSDQAFAHYAKGNALRRTYHPFDGNQIKRLVDRSIEVFDADVLSRQVGAKLRDPIFIVGMPRAGSTLVEQILSSHSEVEGTAELPDLPIVVGEPRQPSRYDRGA